MSIKEALTLDCIKDEISGLEDFGFLGRMQGHLYMCRDVLGRMSKHANHACFMARAVGSHKIGNNH